MDDQVLLPIAANDSPHGRARASGMARHIGHEFPVGGGEPGRSCDNSFIAHHAIDQQKPRRRCRERPLHEAAQFVLLLASISSRTPIHAAAFSARSLNNPHQVFASSRFRVSLSRMTRNAPCH